MRRLFGWGLVGCLLFVSVVSHAATFHPFKGWRTIDTEHFSIHYHQSLESVARKSAGYFEEVHTKLSPKYEWKPWGRTEVVLTDQFDASNGFASTLPYNWIQLRIAPPPPESSLSTHDDWLKGLITHEYTHILHIDANRGIWKVLRWLGLGKLVSPAGLTPNWVKEGAATLEETLGTRGGRGRASYSDMLVRTAILTNNFPTIDRADGVHWKWPSAKAPYIFGVKFLEYLKEKYGEEKLQQFHRESQKSIFLGANNTFAKRAFGKKFYTLWRDWQKEIRNKYTAWQGKEVRKGLTKTRGYLGGDDSYALPTFSPDGKKVAYVTYHPKRGTTLWLQDVKTEEREKLGKKKPSQISFSPDGTKLVYSAISRHKGYYFYYDLYQIDLTKKKKKAKKLTKGERARDPDYSPDGKKIVFVSGRGGTDQLKTYDVETKEITALTGKVTPFSQFAYPRFSPNGRQLAFVHFKNGRGWELCLADANGSSPRCINKNGIPVESRPSWTLDGHHILFSSDRDGVSNIYAYDWKAKTTKRITRVTTGVFQPVMAPDGRTLLVRYYNGDGYDIRKVKFKLKSAGATTRRFPKPTLSDNIETKQYGLGKYNAFRKSLLLPRFVIPGALLLDNGVLLTAMTGSYDPLRYHGWLGGVTYHTNASHLGYFGNYAYRRFLPTIGAGVANYVIDYGTSTGTGNRLYVERLRGYFYTSIPFTPKQGMGFSYFYEDRNNLTNLGGARLNLGVFSGFSSVYFYGSKEAYPASISIPEKGRQLRLVGTWTDNSFGSGINNEQRIFFGDFREYLPLGNNTVFALRMAGGIAWGDRIRPGTFTLGGSLGEGLLAGPASNRYLALRGLPLSSLVRDRIMLISGELRLPLVSPQRGLGTNPIFLNNLHLALFSDYGDAWDVRDIRSKRGFADFFDDFMMSVGMEMRADFVIGHGLPLTGRLGYAIIVVNRNRLGNLKDPFLGNLVKNGMVILQWGTSF